MSVALCHAQPTTLRIEENNPGIAYSTATVDSAGNSRCVTTRSSARAVVSTATHGGNLVGAKKLHRLDPARHRLGRRLSGHGPKIEPRREGQRLLLQILGRGR
jgi:hypothetical protein